MLSHNNSQELIRKYEPKKQHFTIKKLSIGVASVLLGVSFAAGVAHADTTAASQGANGSDASQQAQSSDQGLANQDSKVTIANPATTTPATKDAATATSTAKDATVTSAAAKQATPATNKQAVESQAPAQTPQQSAVKAANFAATTPASQAPAANDPAVKDVTNYNDLQKYLGDSSVSEINLHGTITATGDLNVTREVTLHGVDGAILTLGRNKLNNSGQLTLDDLTLNGSVVGGGTVDIKGTVNSNVDSINSATLSDSQLNDQVGTGHPGANTDNWKAANIAASKVNVEEGATLNINRSIVGDGIVLTGGTAQFVADGSTFGTSKATNDLGSMNVGINANLTINLKDAQTANKTNEQEYSLDNASTGIRAQNGNGHFTTGDSAKVTINAGHGRAVVFGEKFGGNTTIYTDILPTWQTPRTGDHTVTYKTYTTNSSFILGDSTTMNITGRDGILLGDRATFETGDHSQVNITNQGNGSGLILGNFSTATVSAQSSLIMNSDGKNRTGSYAGGNYIGLGDNGQFRVEHDATFRYRLVDATNSTQHLADNMNIISESPNALPSVYVGNNATFDGESDYNWHYGEIFAYPLGPANTVFQIDGAKYVNWEKNSVVRDGTANLYYSMGKGLIDTTSGEGRTYYVFKWDQGNVNDGDTTFDSSSLQSMVDSINNFKGSSDEYWQNVKHLGTTYSKGGNTSEFEGHEVTASDMNGDATPGMKHGNILNDFSNSDVNKQGFNPEKSQRLIIVGTIIPTQEDESSQQTQNYNVQVVYDANLKPGQVELVQQGVNGLARTTNTTYYNVDLASGNKTLDTTKGDNGHSTTTTVLNQEVDEIIHVGPQTATINYQAKDANGNVSAIKDASGNAIVGTVSANPIATTQDGQLNFDKDGNAVAATVNYTDADANLQKAEAATPGYEYSQANDQWAQAVQQGTNVYNVSGLTKADIQTAAEKAGLNQAVQVAQNGPVYNVVLDQKVVEDQGIQKVTVGEDVSRDVDYKENTNNSTDFTDGLNGDSNQRNEAAGLPNMNVPAGTQTKQTVHLTGTGYLNKNTGQFVKVDANGHAIDSQGRLVTYDQAGNVVVGQLDASGKVVPLLTNGQTTATSFVQGSLVWTVGQPADGWNVPDVNDYSHVPGTVPALDNNTMVTMDGQQMTLKDLLDTLNGNAQTQNAVAADTITDAANYPQMSQVVPANQYIFDQFQAVDATGANLPYVVTLTVDRNNPTGGVYMYVTDPSYQTIYWSSMRDNGGKAIAVNGTSPAYYYNTLPNGQRFQINVENFGGDYGNSVSVWSNNVQLRHIFGYGAVDTSVTASAWGDFKPHQVTQTIKYVDQNNANQDIINEVKVTGLTGQQFNAKGTNDAKIPGYTLTNNDAASGTVSDYQVGHTYVRTWYDPATKSTITEHFTLKNAQGDMDVVVTVNGQQVTGQAEKTGNTTTVGANDFYDVHIGNSIYGIQNPFVPSTDTVTLEYTQDQAKTDPYYVVYTKQGSLTVVFHDDKTGQDLKTVKTGMEDNGTKVTYTPTDDLKTLENEGYVHVSTDGEIPATIEGGKTPTVTIHLTHGVQPVTPQTPPTDVPNNTPKDAQPDQLTKQVTETVAYVNSDGTTFSGTVPANAKQTVTFTGTAYVDKVTGELVNAKQVDGSWVIDTDSTATPVIQWTAEDGKNSFDAVTSPAEAGYHVTNVSDHADGNNVAAINGLNQDSSNVNITVTYTADDQTVLVKYIDDKGNDLSSYNKTITGKPGTALDYTTKSTIDELKAKGYVLVSDNFDVTTMPKDGGTYEVHLTHGVQPVTPGTPTDQVPNNTPKDAQPDQLTKQVTETVTYVNSDGTAFTGTVPANAKQTVTFTGTAYVDKVTGELVNAKQVDGNWVVDTDNTATAAIQWTAEDGKNSFDAVTSPAEAGYHVASVSDHADGNNVAAINGLNQDSGNVTVTVTYAPNGQNVINEHNVPASQTVRYVDDQGNVLLSDAKQSQNFHYSGDTVDATTGDQIKAGSWDASSHTFTAENVPVIPGYVAVKGYTVDQDGNYVAGGFDTTPTESKDEQNRTFTVTYHKVGNIVPVLPDGKTPVPGSTPQQYPNDPNNPTKVIPNEKVPYIPGYTPSVPTVTPGDPTVDTPVVYTADDQTVLVKYIDDKGTDLSSYNKTITGKPGAELDYTTKDTITALEAKGYVLVSDNFDVTTMPKDGGTYEVHLTHGLVPVGPNTPTDQNHGVDPSQVKKDVNETVHYVGAGENTPKDNVQTSEWGRTVTVDAVTNQIVDGKYTTDWKILPGQKTSYDAVSTPVVDGYHADKAQVAGTAVTQDNIYEEVTYSPNGKIVPQDPNGNPIPNVPTPQYPTDPHDPTGVTPNEPVPVIPGYTPSVPTVTPEDPGKDTPVIYTPKTPAKDQGAVINYIDADNHNALITTSGEIDGKAGAKINYSTAEEIAKLEDQGYVLVTDGFPAGATYDSDDNTVQTYTVVLRHGTGKESLEVTGHQTIHYVGAGANTPKDVVEDYTFTKSVTIDKVTGKIIDNGQWSDTSHTFGTKDTPVVDGYHADKRYAGGETITPDDLNKTVTVTYSPNGRIIPVDPDGKPIPKAPTPQYPTNPNDPTGVIPDEPVPHIDGYTPSTDKVTPKDPGKDTPVVYTPEKPKGSETPVAQGSVTVIYVDDTTNTVIPNVSYNSGKEDKGTKVTYTTVATLNELEQKGYVYDKTDGTIPAEIGDSDVTVRVHLHHGTQPVSPDQPGTPGTPINPNDPTGPKYPEGTDKASLDKTVTRTVQYVDDDGNVVATAVEQPVTFTASGELDKVTGEWTKPLTWSADQALAGVGIPTVDGYHVISIDKDANGLTSVKGVTLSHSDSDYTVTVTYAKDSAPVTPTVPEDTVVKGKQTVHYVDQNGKELKPTATTGNVTFTKDGTTGKWDQDSHTYGNVTAPVIPGYVVNVSTVGGKTVTPDDPDQDITFTYTPVGKITPVDPGGSPIPGAPTPKYPNDPNDPTGVTPNEPVPDIPGYTPVTPTVTPDNPTVDTPVTYVPKETPKTPETPQTPQTPATPKAPEAPRTPAQPAAPATPTATPAAPVAPRAITPAAAPKAAAKKLPQTGNQDDSRLATLGLAALSMVGLSAGLLGGKRRKHQD